MSTVTQYQTFANYGKGFMQKDDSSDNIYYNIEISNPLLTGTENSQVQAQYFENTSQAILTDPSQYYLTIARFSVPGSAIPIFIMDIINNQANPNLTPYIVCLSYNGNDYPVNIIYYPLNNELAPTTAIPEQQVNNGYYYVYSYDHMIQMINIAFATSFHQLKAANPGAPPTQPPFVIYDPISQLISLVVQKEYVPQPVGPAATIDVYVNANLLNTYLESISAMFYGYNQPNGKDFKFQINYKYNNGYSAKVGSPSALANSSNPYYVSGTVATALAVTTPTQQYIYGPANPPDFLIFTQEYSMMQYWNSFKNIVFISGTIAVQGEYIPQKINQNTSSQGAVSFRPILTDFQPELDSPGAGRTIMQYFPQGPYRLVDLVSTQPMNKIDIGIYWQDRDDDLWPVYLNTNQSASIKLLFIRK